MQYRKKIEEKVLNLDVNETSDFSEIIEKIKKRLFYTVRPHPNSKFGKCQIELADK